MDQPQGTVNQEQICMDLILHGGNARAEAFSALESARAGRFEEAEARLAAADGELKLAHEAQARLLTEEAGGLQAGGVKQTPTLLLVHAHGHVMSAITERTLIEELVRMYRRLPPE